jgi:ABC-type transport system substrate-binding protein
MAIRRLVLKSIATIKHHGFLTPLIILVIAGIAAVSCGDDATSTPLPGATATPTTAAAPPTATTRPSATPTPTPEQLFVTPTPTPLVQPTATATPPPPERRAGRLLITLSNLNDEVWRRDVGSAGEAVESAIYEFLADREQDWTLRPMLAQRWEMTPDALSWTFFLTGKAEWDGGNYGPFSADDVVYTWQSYMAEDAVSSEGRLIRNRGGVASTVDPITFKMTMTEPSWDFILMNTIWPTSNAIFSRKYADEVGSPGEYARKPIGSGPYRLAQHDVKNTMLMTRIPDHWRVGDSQGWEEIFIRLVPEDTTRLAMLLTEESYLADLTGDTQQQARDDGLVVPDIGGFTLTLSLAGMWDPTIRDIDTTIPYVGDWRDTDDPNGTWQRALKVRKAMNLAIDRQAIVDNFFGGQTEALAVNLYWPGSVYQPADMVPYPYDPTLAKQLMAEAGYPNGDGWGTPYEMVHAIQVGAEAGIDIGAYVANQWRDVLGIPVRETTRAWSADYSPEYRVTPEGQRSAKNSGAVIRFSRFRAEPVSNLMLFGSYSPATFSLLGEHPDHDRDLEDAFNTFDTDERVKKQQDIAWWFYDNYWNVPIIVHPIYQAYNPDIVAEYPLIRDASRPLMFERIIPGPGALQ